MIGNIARILAQFKQSWSRELEDGAIIRACEEAGHTWRERELGPVATVKMFFLQILFGNVACDYVQVPPQSAFAHPLDFYRTALHEVSHLVGSAARLGRDQSGRFGSALYAKEELVAELSAAYLCAALGIAPTVRHADYLASWLAVLRADSRAIFKAASQASKAADYLLAFERNHECTLERAA